MKKLFLLSSISVFIGLMFLVFCTSQAYADPPFDVPPKGGLPACMADLDFCDTDLAACEAADRPIFPGDGYYPSPDAFGVPGHGPELSYTINGDGTFTDDNSLLIWEIKDNMGEIHDKDNTYMWSDDAMGTADDGTLFTVFLDTLNNKCDGDETTPCEIDMECNGIGNGLCGHAGYSDWRIPNIKEMQSIIDYSSNNPAYSASGLTATGRYWSATTDDGLTTNAWVIVFINGSVVSTDKGSVGTFARAVRTP